MAEITGLRELDIKLGRLQAKLGAKTLRQAAVAAVKPTIKVMKMAAPVGSEAHRTHEGRLVAPGFLSRSVRYRSRVRDGVATVTIGVLKAAFYGVQFVERGTRFMSARPWFESTFERMQGAVEQRFASDLRKRIEKVARS